MVYSEFTLLENRLKKVSTKIFDCLQEPYSQEQILQLASKCNLKLPESLVRLYSWKNGLKEGATANFWYGIGFHPIESVLNTQVQPCLVDVNNYLFCEKGITSDSGALKLLEIGNDSGRCFLCANMSDHRSSSDCQVVLVDNEYRVILKVADSIEQMLISFAEDLGSGKYSLLEEALDDGIEFLEVAPDVDIVNWHNIDRYKNILPY